MTMWWSQVPIRSPQGQILEAENPKIKKFKFFEFHSNWMKLGDLTKFCPRNSNMLSVWPQNGSRAPLMTKIEISPLFPVYQPTYMYPIGFRPPLTPLFFPEYEIKHPYLSSDKKSRVRHLAAPFIIRFKVEKNRKIPKKWPQKFFFKIRIYFPRWIGHALKPPKNRFKKY